MKNSSQITLPRWAVPVRRIVDAVAVITAMDELDSDDRSIKDLFGRRFSWMLLLKDARVVTMRTFFNHGDAVEADERVKTLTAPSTCQSIVCDERCAWPGCLGK